ncbi:unnamed protein product [Rotaria sp. Silwood2]|nr:unnamed protein product [Rotaria sp. Silwood2]
MATTMSTASKRSKTIEPEHFCFVSFPSEGTHGIWPENLIRTKGRFGFQAKFGEQWYECRVEMEGTKEECEEAQDLLEKSISPNQKQWSSAETELSDNEESDITSSSDDENENNNKENINKNRSKKNKVKTTNKKSIIHSTDDEVEILKDISSSINKKRSNHSSNESVSKKVKSDDKTTTTTITTLEQSSSLTTLHPDIVKQISDMIKKESSEMKKLLKKIYQMQKRTSDVPKLIVVFFQTGHPPPSQSEEMVENNVNLMTISATTPSRYLLAAARIVLTHDQFNNGYLPDFRGDKTGRVPIPEAAVMKLKEAVRKRFSFKEADIENIWKSIRTSLVQKVTDVRKRQSEKIQIQEQQPIRSAEEQIEIVSNTTVNQTAKLCGACYSSTADSICSTIQCIHEEMKIPSDDMVEIVLFDLNEQMKLLINKNLTLLQQYQSEARTKTTLDANDIVCGDIYQSILNINTDFFVSVMIHSDGMPLYKSKNRNAWPILGAVLELPPYARNRADNTPLLSLWIGKKKPDFSIIFKKLSEQLSCLKKTGVETINNQNVTIIFPMLMGDMPALSSMVQFVEHNAFYACMFCNTKGTYNNDGHCVIFPLDNGAELRTSENFERCARYADSMHVRVDRERTMGLKGISAFSEILDVPLPHSVVIDPMHTVFLCHSKKLLIHLQTFITKENLEKIHLKLRSINYIHDILRRPRSFTNVKKWKASEIRLFILYIGLPILAEFLPVEIIGDLALYNVILRLLHDHWDDDKKLSDSISFLLKLYIDNLLKHINAGLYPTNLLTISTHTHLHLPLQCKKFGRLNWLTNFVFESFLGFLKGFVKGSSGAGNQIAFAFISNFYLSKTKENASRSFGHFCINNDTFGSNILKEAIDETTSHFLNENGYISSDTIYFSRLHHLNITYHSFLYSRKGSSCSYLVSYEKNDVLMYGYILFFLSTDRNCLAVIQKLSCVDYSLTSCFSSYKYITAIKDFIDNVYIVVKRVQPSMSKLDQVDICDIKSLRSRCFSVPFGNEFMILTNYSFAYEHN